MTTPTYPFTGEGLAEALKALGSTPGEVAESLSSMGFTGQVNEPLCCPVANYLRGSIVGAHEACIGKDENYRLFAQVEDRQKSHVDVPLVPVPVAEFVSRFDASLYPDLIEEGR